MLSIFQILIVQTMENNFRLSVHETVICISFLEIIDWAAPDTEVVAKVISWLRFVNAQIT